MIKTFPTKMSFNVKGLLQEHCQKRKVANPIYERARVGGEDHEPLWISTVTVDQLSFTGDVQKSKILADQAAADIALASLQESERTRATSKILDESTVVLVDVENLPKFIDELKSEVSKCNVIAFVGEHHPLAEKTFPSNVLVIKTDSTRKDATDTCMQVYVGCLLAKNTYENYIIVTRDHFGSSLVDTIRSSRGNWMAKNARLVTSVSQL